MTKIQIATVRLANLWSELPSEVKATIYITASIFLQAVATDIANFQYHDIILWGWFFFPAAYQAILATGIANVLLVSVKKLAAKTAKVDTLREEYLKTSMDR